MAPLKKGVAPTSSASSQRTIASFFGSKPPACKPSEDSMKSPKVKLSLSTPAEGGDVVHQSTPIIKRARTGSKHTDSVTTDGEGELKSLPPISPEFRLSGKKDDYTKCIPTPSPSEGPCPAKSTTKTFARRKRNSAKSALPGVVDQTQRELTSGDAQEAKVTITPELVIGKRLKVWWPLDKVWYSGRVKAYDELTGNHVVAYDDGEDESVVLDNEKIEWLEEAEDPSPKSTVPVTTACNRRRPIEPHPSTTSTKRKKTVVSCEDAAPRSPKQEPDEEERGPGESKRRTKRARMMVVEEESPLKLTVSDDVYDEVDMLSPAKEEVTVRRRLRKKVSVIEDNDVQEITRVEAEEVEEHKVGTRPSKRSILSARRLQLEKIVDDDENMSPTLDENDAADLVPEKQSLKSDKEKDQTRAKDFFSKLGVKPPKAAREALAGDLKSSSSPEKERSCKSLKEVEAEKLARGELHCSLVGEAAQRFGGRVDEKFKFLGRSRRDASGRRPSDPDFDPRTVLLPPEFLKGLSGGQRQWWEFKSKHMDKVLLFKMGKFYEMFEMDAHIGAQEIDLQYMKSENVKNSFLEEGNMAKNLQGSWFLQKATLQGEQPHCGFPEKNYAVNAEKLARKGYRVLIVEQTETPDQLEQRRRETGSKDKVVKREVCGVITKGTIVDGDMLVARPDAAFLMSITEMPPPSDAIPESQACIIGICTVDTSTSHIMLGQFTDDSARSRLRSVLSELRPVELVKPQGLLSDATERALKDHTRCPLVNTLKPGKEFWDAAQSLKELTIIYESLQEREKPSGKLEKSKVERALEPQEHLLPKALRQVVDCGTEGEAALSALGGSLFYLRQALLDQTLLRLGRIDLLPGSDSFRRAESAAATKGSEWTEGGVLDDRVCEGNMARDHVEPYMGMDSAALENLEIIENNRDGGTSGTLLAHLDHCATPYGRRLLRQWLIRPLLRVDAIVQRQQVILDLKGVAADGATKFRKELAGQPDMERLLSRLHACSDASGRNAQKVVLYEDAAKKQLQEFMAALRGCRALLQAVKCFEDVLPALASSKLKKLAVPGDGSVDMTAIIEHFETAFDYKEAEKTGRIVPREGVDEDFDEADATVTDVTEKLMDYIDKQRRKFGNSSEINYVTVGKEAYQMEVPETLHSKVPTSFEVRSSRKGYRRYWTPEIKELLQELAAGEQQRELALRGILQGLVKRFCQHYQHWLCLIKSVAEIDVLISLTEASEYDASNCRPSFNSNTSPQTPMIVAKGLRHATLRPTGGGTVVPNDIMLGSEATPFMLLTGPNMGGKSTLIRQVCLAVVLAQVGAYVPAEKFELSPVDRLFVRMGARDHIMAGQSTFLVELSETASMLRCATSNSLVALDELGRGTSTSDGQAIAHAVMEHLAHTVGCRGIFSTHYHRLATNYSADPRVGLYHMSCKVGAEAGGLEEVTFLYKLASGSCPKSYGVNVARLAGMPEAVLQRAAARASELELSWGEGDNSLKEGSAKEQAGKTSQIVDIDIIMKDVFDLLEKLPGDEEAINNRVDVLLPFWNKAKQIFLMA